MSQASARPKPLHEYPVLVPGGHVLSHFGVDTSKFNALSWIADDVVLIPAGKFLLFVNVKTGAVESQEGPDTGGVGAVAVHPSRKHFVVGERHPQNPRLLIHEWPSRKQSGKFDGTGCSVGYAACCFDRDGTRVATVGAAPDFTLAVWDWESRTMSLRSKCFSSDVYTVCFSAFDNSRLVTGGSAHIKFWSMAETFTGLKLQGTLGKFGRLEISNISGFVVFPDGKVLSGSESGSLLLWEGDLVKCSFVRRGRDTEESSEGVLACHRGPINAVSLVHDAKVVVSFGSDGWIRYWSREEIELAEGDGVPALYTPKCLAEVCVDPCSELRSVTLRDSAEGTGTQEWVLLDSGGTIKTSPLPSLEQCFSGTFSEQVGNGAAPPAPVIRFNGGGFTCAATSPIAHVVVTGGEDGVVRLLDYVSGAELAHVSWPHRISTGEHHADPLDATAAPQMSPAVPVTTVAFFANDPSHTHLVAGFGDGTVRLLTVHQAPSPFFSFIGQWKPHASDLFVTVLDTREQNLCTVSHDGTAFFFTVSPSFETLEPVGFCKLPLSAPTCAEWDEEGQGCFIGFAGGQILSIRAPAAGDVDHALSFEFPCCYTLIGIRQRRLPPPIPENERNGEETEEDLLEEKDNGPWPISLLRRVPGAASGALAVGMQKDELLYTYKATVRYENAVSLPPLPPTGVEPPDYVEEPEENLCYRDLVPQRAALGPAGNELLVVCSGARVLVRQAAVPAQLCSSSATVSLMQPVHDSTHGTITSAQLSFDGAVVVTTGTDGLVVAQVRAGCEAPEHTAVPHHLLPEQSRRPQEEEPQRHGEPNLAGGVAPSAPTGLSIQEQKEADDEARARAEREERRKEFLEKIFALQERYAAVKAMNDSLPESARLSEEAIRLDEALQAKLVAERDRRVEEARKEYAVDSARENLRTKKLRSRFVDNLLHDRFQVHSFRRGFSVATFRTPDPSAAISRLQGEIAALNASDNESDTDEGIDATARQDEDGTAGTGHRDEKRCKALLSGEAHSQTQHEVRPADGNPFASNSDAVSGAESRKAEKTACGGAVATRSDGQSLAAADAHHTAAAAPAVAAAAAKTSTKVVEKVEKSSMNATVRQLLQKADERRQERQMRRDGYAALLATAPNPEEDVALLRDMTRRDLEERGECVMRTDPHYKGEDEFRPTASAKLHRMIALERLLVAKRVTFNEQLVAARERKRTTLQTLNKIRARIREMNEELCDGAVNADTLVMQPDEEPEKAFEIDRAGLDAFAKRKAEEKLKEEEAKKAQRGFGADLAEAPQQQRESSGTSKRSVVTDRMSFSRRDTFGTRADSHPKESRNASRLTRGSRQSIMFLSAANRDRMETEVKSKLESIKLCEIEEEEQAMRREQLTCERSRLVLQADDIMRSFDDELYGLFRQHADVDADLCLGDVHLLLLFREYQMLLVFRNQDRELRRQLRSATASREVTRRTIRDLEANSKSFEATLTALQEKLKSHKRDAEAYIQESIPGDRVGYLLKIYNRHIKRRRNVEEAEDNDDITSDDEDEDVDDCDSEIGEEACPPNCDVAAWEHVLALREARLDINDDVTKTRKRRDDTHKKLEQGAAALEGIVASVQECLARIEELDHEKRRQLNNLSIVVPLRCSQVKCLGNADESVPGSLWDQDVVVLPEEEISRLSNRVLALADQKEQRRDEIASTVAELQRLQTEKADMQKVHAHWEAQVHEVMMLKFGRHVDLEMLESCGTSRRIEAKKEELRRTEFRWDREVRKRENHIAALRDELQRNLLHNTHLLQDLGDFEGERQQAERTLAKASTGVVSKFRGSRVATKADRANLRELIAAQQEEMDALNAEILMLRRKGGHAYSPAAASY